VLLKRCNHDSSKCEAAFAQYIMKLARCKACLTACRQNRERMDVHPIVLQTGALCSGGPTTTQPEAQGTHRVCYSHPLGVWLLWTELASRGPAGVRWVTAHML
jgi:hypothetical protein